MNSNSSNSSNYKLNSGMGLGSPNMSNAANNPNNLAAFISNYPNFIAAAAQLNNGGNGGGMLASSSDGLDSATSSPASSISSANIESGLSSIHRPQAHFASANPIGLLPAGANQVNSSSSSKSSESSSSTSSSPIASNAGGSSGGGSFKSSDYRLLLNSSQQPLITS